MQNSTTAKLSHSLDFVHTYSVIIFLFACFLNKKIKKGPERGGTPLSFPAQVTGDDQPGQASHRDVTNLENKK